MNCQDVIDAWDNADPRKIHPTRAFLSEAHYWTSDEIQAKEIAACAADGSSILDYGCGDGRVTIPLANLGRFRVTAADTSPRMLQRLAQYLAVATDPPVLNTELVTDETVLEGFDLVVCLAVLIHQDYTTAKHIIQRLVKAAKPGGLLVLDWPVSDTPHERDSWIDVTTWSVADRNSFAVECDLAPMGSVGGHSMWQRC